MLGIDRLQRACGLLLLAALWPAAGWSHNESVHQRMTDYAYNVLLAGSSFSEGGSMPARLRSAFGRLQATDPSFAPFFAAASASRGKLRALHSGLPVDAAPCLAMPAGVATGGLPDWQLPTGLALADQPMAKVRLPVTHLYGHAPVICAIDAGYTPNGILASVNTGSLTTRDHTGVTLGYWAASPDKQTDDWILRSTTLEALQNPIALASVGVGTTVTVSAACVLACGLFPPACAACPVLAVVAAGVVIDEISSIDASSLESEDYVGLGHFVDMKPVPASPAPFDDKPGKFMPRAGPNGVPDAVEDLVTMVFDIGGFHVNTEKSQALKNYQIVLGTSGAIGDDFHRNTTLRTAGAWQSSTVPHTQLTSVDNLAMHGYFSAKAQRGTAEEAHHLGWPLHALGDATVPMHAVGASGFGHRPYEDSVDAGFDGLTGAANLAASVATVVEVVKRAHAWRQFIQAWRSTHASTEVPVRDLIEALAARTRTTSNATASVFKAAGSLAYLVDKDAAISLYENPAMAAIQRKLLIEGIAAELAFLIAFTEVAP